MIVAAAQGDAEQLERARNSAAHRCVLAGEFTRGVEHAEKVLRLYGAERRRHPTHILWADPKTQAGLWGSICTWMLGYPDRALQLETKGLRTPANLVTRLIWQLH